MKIFLYLCLENQLTNAVLQKWHKSTDILIDTKIN